jgi:hypothetical protein
MLVLLTRCFRRLLMLIFVVSFVGTAPCFGSVALLMEEPYGELGSFDPTGHAAVYLNHICAASPIELRICKNGEAGVVISRYHKINRDDWIAIPLIPYLYSVTDAAEAPASVDKARVIELRRDYWKDHLTLLAPPDKNGDAPPGEWVQLVGSSYDRTIHGFQVETTAEQDERLIAYFNDRRNVGHFNLFFHNCADFSRVVLDIYFPHAIHRNFVADLGVMTPKQAARSLVRFGKKHPELQMTAFTIPQVPGSIPRSHSVDGVAESLLKSRKYILPLVVLSPEVAGAVAVSYLTEGRLKLPKNTVIFEPGNDERVERASATVAPLENVPASQAAPLPQPAIDRH